jgi:hypothetical protein
LLAILIDQVVIAVERLLDLVRYPHFSLYYRPVPEVGILVGSPMQGRAMTAADAAAQLPSLLQTQLTQCVPRTVTVIQQWVMLLCQGVIHGLCCGCLKSSGWP